ncbi:hypothetical protein BDFB_000399 [Asbolus verrucosus]|uniref:Uncharacterized protein n=1 Tax=Asbolus verrucosus TaxID=1661398 RepID=A0A482W4I4_ASBVE|nr:hypothetical protein BDFB_000399 [Asbolus verrucosus]
MLINLLIFVPLFVASVAQRPFFAGSRPIGRPDLAARFRDEIEPTPIYTRIGEDNAGGNQNFQPRSEFGQNGITPTAQRPFFAGSRPIGRPDLAARFKDEIEPTPVYTRIGEDNAGGNQNFQSRSEFGQNKITPAVQRPFYAGSRPIGSPNLAARFKDEDETAEKNVQNRNGGGEEAALSENDWNTKFVNRVNEWPRENRPFEVLNAGHIEAAKYPQGTQNFQSRSGFGQDGITSNVQRPFFAGSRPIDRPDLAARFKDEDETTEETIYNGNGGFKWQS